MFRLAVDLVGHVLGANGETAGNPSDECKHCDEQILVVCSHAGRIAQVGTYIQLPIQVQIAYSSAMRARWTPTRTQIQQVVTESRGRYAGFDWPHIYRVVPRKLITNLMPFRRSGGEYAGVVSSATGVKGGPIYVRELAELMRAHVALPPACCRWVLDENDKLKLAPYDGHHRINAAFLAGITEIPVVIWKTPRGPWKLP